MQKWYKMGLEYQTFDYKELPPAQPQCAKCIEGLIGLWKNTYFMQQNF